MVQLYTKKISDLHAHSIFSDGDLSIEDSIRTRMEKIHGVLELGISDHYQAIRDEKKWREYMNEITRCKDLFSAQNIEVKVGIEIYAKDLKKELPLIHFSELDYVIIENYESYKKLDDYKQLILTLRERFQGQIILAHPELDDSFEALGEKGFRKLLQFLNEYDIPLEMNLNFGYWFTIGIDPMSTFYKASAIMKILNEESAKLSIGTDAHGYEDWLFSNYEIALSFFKNNL